METEELQSGEVFNPHLEARLNTQYMEDNIEKQIEQMELSRDVNIVLSRLNYREQQVIRAYFGIDAEEKDTLQLSQEYNISRQRIGQIKNKALAKLRRHPFRKILTPYLENSLLREH